VKRRWSICYCRNLWEMFPFEQWMWTKSNFTRQKK